MGNELRRWMRLVEAIDLDAEHWEVVNIGGDETAVGWRLDKDADNKVAHAGLSLADGIPVLQNEASYTAPQAVDGQDREIYAGFGAGNRRLFMAVQWLDELDFPAFALSRFETSRSGISLMT